MKYDADFLLRFHEGRLSPEERSSFERVLASDPALQKEIEHMASVRDALRATRTREVKPFFAERVLRHLRPAASPDVSLYLSLRWAFVRASAVAAVVALVLAGLNAGAYGELDVATSIVDAVFGIPDASPIEAWTYTGLTSEMPSP
jgi:anti-sigma factor RsiW